MSLVHVNGQPIHYLEAGSGRPIVLLHAFPFDARMFGPQLDSLSKHFRVIAPDLRGFGKTPGDGVVSPDDQALMVAGFLDALEIDSAVVGGVSMGGYVTLAMLRVAAHKVSALLLMDTQPTPDDAAAKQKREDQAQRIEKEGLDFYIELNLFKLVSKSSSPQLQKAVTDMIRAQSREGTAGGLRGMALRPDSRDMLARFGGKALIVVGAEDEVTPVAKAELMKDLVPGSRVEVIPGAAHLANWEKPEPVNRAIADFVSGL